MDIFYFILFGAVGIFNILASVLDWKWYIDSAARQLGNQGRRNLVRVLIGIAGVLLTLFGTAVLVGWL